MSAGLAIPIMGVSGAGAVLPCPACPPPLIHAIGRSSPVCGSPHSVSQAFIWPICCCWLVMMSNAIRRMSSSSLRSRMRNDISTACAWWSCMSRANPASALWVSGVPERCPSA